MTAQISDTVVYHDDTYDLAGIGGEGLFDPARVGLLVVPISTACSRGYYCTYVVRDGGIQLVKLSVGFCAEDRVLAESGRGPLRFGLLPRRDSEEHRAFRTLLDPYAPESAPLETEEVTVTLHSDWYYAPLACPVCFTGGLLLGKDFVTGMYDHAGHQPAYKYEEVHELVFEDGRLVATRDRSADMVTLRKRIAGIRDADEIRRADPITWIREFFDLDYRW